MGASAASNGMKQIRDKPPADDEQAASSGYIVKLILSPRAITVSGEKDWIVSLESSTSI